MKISPIFHQINCNETRRADYRQARAVLKYKPDIIFFELSEKNGSPDSGWNKLSLEVKPFKKIEADAKGLRKYYKKSKDGVALSDALMWEGVAKVWRGGKNTMLYLVDAPDELRLEFLEAWNGCYPCASKNWLWWVRIYLRERIMANHIGNIFKKYEGKEHPVILIFLQSFHWTHVKFLLTNPTKAEIYRYYFGKFWRVNRKNIAEKIKKNNKMFYRYWMKYSDFK